jgi:two-component system cell cycle sensor histidine kinase PleC
MPIPGEQPDLTALPPETSPVKRRLAAQYVREARDRLTSSSGTRPAFDYELLRQYAQNRLSASLVMLLLVATIGFLSSLWTGAMAAGAWTASVLVIHAVMVTKCRQFLDQPMNETAASTWRLRFIMLDLFYGLAWMFILIHPVSVDESSSTFMLFVMLLVVAVSSMLASSLPIAVFAATFPVTAAVALNFVLQGTLRDYILATMAITLFDHTGDAGRARRKRRADRRTRTGESDFRRGAPARGSRQYFQIALPGADEPRIAHTAQRHPWIFRSDEDRSVRRACGAGL